MQTTVKSVSIPPWVDHELGNKRRRIDDHHGPTSPHKTRDSDSGWLLDASSEAASGMTRTLVGGSVSREDEHESVALYSVEDLHPDASSADNRGSSMITEGAKTTTEGAGRSKSSEGALSKVVPV